MSRKPLIAGNWKMNHGVTDTIKFFTKLSAQKISVYNADVVICPPFTSLYTASVALSEETEVKLGAQNCHYEDNGAYTGEVSLDFLLESNCQYVIIGHSERRQHFHETNELLAKKVSKALQKKIVPIFCVGETLEQREKNETFSFIESQLEGSLGHISKDEIAKVVIAYEPIWAIGTGKTASPGQAQEVHHMIRDWIGKKYGTSFASEMRILYGGSVKPNNIRELIQQEDIDGALVGGASLKAEDFSEIIRQSTSA